tara:strand:- start:5972 stop:7357 length:1386 start_codon:yes stop_codon:yes gene_type:complete
MENEIKDLINLLKSKRFDEILRQEKEIVDKFPNDPVLFDILGLANTFLQNNENAIRNFKKALEINPNFFQSLNNLGNLMFDLKRFDDALDNYKRALTNSSKNKEIYNNIANVYSEIGQIDDAIKNFKKAIEIDSSFFQAYNGLGNAQKKMGLFAEAISSYQKSIDINPSYHLAHNNLGVAYYQIGRVDESLKSYNNVLKINPSYAPVYWNIHGCSSDITEAKNLLNKCIGLDQNFLKAKYCLSFIKAYEGDYSDYNYLLDSKDKDDPYLRSFKWIFSLPNKPNLFFSRWLFFDFIIGISNKSRPFYEFGVWTGLSFKYFLNYFEKGFGFDTFTGLPESWYNEPKGFYTNSNKIPKINGANFIKGEFKETLPKFFSTSREKASIINYDADLYSSTICALENSKKVIDENTILIFDEFIINDTWEEDEFRALNEFSQNNSYIYEVIAISLFTKQVAVRLKRDK